MTRFRNRIWRSRAAFSRPPISCAAARSWEALASDSCCFRAWLVNPHFNFEGVQVLEARALSEVGELGFAELPALDEVVEPRELVV